MDSNNTRLNVESLQLKTLLKSLFLSEYLELRLINEDKCNLKIIDVEHNVIISVFNIADILTFEASMVSDDSEIQKFSLIEYIAFSETELNFNIFYLGDPNDLAEPDVANTEIMDENISFISEN